MLERKIIFGLLVIAALLYVAIYHVFVAPDKIRVEFGKLPLVYLWSGSDSSKEGILSPVELTEPQSYDEIMESFLKPIPGPNITKETWKGQCPYPWYLSPEMQEQSWFQPFLRRLQRVDLSKAHNRYIQMRDCARWWSPTPQVVYDDPPPRSRLVGWKPKPAPPPGYKRPKCKNFGQDLIPGNNCSKAFNILWRTFDKLGIVYFPRSGTELGAVRKSGYLWADGDYDIYVDMPQKMLKEKLDEVLGPNVTHFSEYKEPYWFRSEVHWYVSGCPEVHMVFNDWMEDEMSQGNFSQRSGHLDMCECMMNSVPMSCHKESVYRIWLKYGPSWRVPLNAKALDVPHRGFQYNIVRKLRKLANYTDIIYEDAIRGLDPNITYTAPEMDMILAQLNDLHALITCQGKARCLKG